ncbi:flagellar hook-length control protein FliK [Clostridium tetanomorphum]|uniref:Flagellar hook-length control protein FliK n=1 Tax=Clostridium tetanomorphum TaxID=1553 RepID=A0A923E7S1_CLOTT|nr:flagellar hook-length control protein FliK [Clostridium tetanomorphum]KAJ49914.1 flagellar hook-length control protein [Clostridium tetanomorphum DSM 665]MBC2396681.1 flagellar hook-length control protein FliK [Clostridium tetanomorphum]MBP1866148.1 flagellar hook-length control protein FliK [Clostridium tetanomorphum]NRS85127.1 flagellar hook-length control protein FliK [Clostridium tetanomorphum]NRZ98308.1 flagellar hook-length control protein FliK [Clostridium tetanomorphum]
MENSVLSLMNNITCKEKVTEKRKVFKEVAGDDFTKTLKNVSSKDDKDICKLNGQEKVAKDDSKLQKITNESSTNGNEKSEVDKTIKDSEKVKSLLTKAGVSEDKIAEVDLKEGNELLTLLTENNIDLSKLNINELILLIQQLMNMNNNAIELKDLRQGISNVVSNAINDLCSKDKNINLQNNDLILNVKKEIHSYLDKVVKDNKELPLIKQLAASLEEKIGNLFNETLKENNNSPVNNIMSIIKKEILNSLKEENDLQSEQGEDKKVLHTKEEVTNVLRRLSSNKNNKEAGENSQFSKDKSNFQQENILKSISGQDKNDKFTKAVNFINQFNSLNNVQQSQVPSIEEVMINKQTVGADVVKAVKYMEVNNMKNLTVKINPKELGELVINITMESGKMKANITANNKEAFNLLNANISDITNKLQNNDIKIQNFTLNLYEDTTFFKDKEGKGKESSNNDNRRNKETKIESLNEIGDAENLSDDLNNLNIFA